MISAHVAVLRKLRHLAGMAIVISAMPLLASRPYVVGNDLAERLARGVAPGQKLILDRVPMIDGNPTTLELEPFEVWAPDAKITVHDANGDHEEAPPRRLFYRGRNAVELSRTATFEEVTALLWNTESEGLFPMTSVRRPQRGKLADRLVASLVDRRVQPVAATVRTASP